MTLENITLFDIGTLGLLATGVLGEVQRYRQTNRLKQAVGLSIIISNILMFVALVWRGTLAGHWPLISSYEFCLTFVLASSIAYSIIGWQTGWMPLGWGVLPVILLLAIYARWGISPVDQAILPIVPALQSLWLPIHVITAALAYGFFAIACGAGLGWLFTQQIADKNRLGIAMNGAVKIGYVWLTASMVTGAIWAQMAWGSYWSWDPKEIWALIVWLIYTLFLHARYHRSWSGHRLAILAVLGFAGVLFTFLGVGQLVRWTSLESLHVF